MQFQESIRWFGSIFILITLTIHRSECEHILFLHHLATSSHVVATWNFADALVSKGHNVTYITSVAPPSINPSIPVIMPQRVSKYLKSLFDSELDITPRITGNMPLIIELAAKQNTIGCELFLNSEELHSWIETTQKVDLIFVDGFPECAVGLAYKLQSKIAIFQTFGLLPITYEYFGIPFESHSVPAADLTFKTPFSFWEKVKTTLLPLAWRRRQVQLNTQIEGITKNGLKLDYLPPLEELIRNISLILFNGHFLDEYRRSLPPFVVSVPGMHVKESHDPLPQELEAFINSPSASGQAPEGFVYISLGTVAKAPKLPQSIRKVFYDSIKAFPEVRFLWRWDGEFPTDIPQNLQLSKWFNQQDLLGHPKIKGFVTQAGRPSGQEAIYNAVPMITFPILGDQDYNANALEKLGAAINLEITDVTKTEFTNALRRLLYDPKFKERVTEVSKLYKDLPMKPVDTAVWWTEYILRHKDTSHLKPLAIDQTWYQKRLLDVWGFLGLCFLAILFISYRIGVFVINLLFGKKIVANNKIENVNNNNSNEYKIKTH